MSGARGADVADQPPAAAAEALDTNYGETGFAKRLGFGARPALLLIDLVEAYFRDGSPLYHAEYRPVLRSALRIREAAHTAGIPVIVTRVEYHKGGIDGGVFFLKARLPLLCFEAGNPLGDFPAGLTIGANDVVLTKKYPSAFFASPLAAMLSARSIDTVLITGVSTSGCVRATAVDACSSGFRPMVVREAVGDRHPAPHEANLFDINAKYGDVVSEAETLQYLATLPAR
jgi:maleamate amidohydrolase